jgi:hypothetical protein
LTWFGNITALLGRWRAALAGVLLLLLALLLFPFSMTSAPRWRLRVIDDAGVAVRGIRVTEHWQHYLVEAEGHEEVRQTDENGSVDFPERLVRASIVRRINAKLRRLGKSGVPAQYLPYASVVVWGSPQYETSVAVCEPDQSPSTEITIQRSQNRLR